MFLPSFYSEFSWLSQSPGREWRVPPTTRFVQIALPSCAPPPRPFFFDACIARNDTSPSSRFYLLAIFKRYCPSYRAVPLVRFFCEAVSPQAGRGKACSSRNASPRILVIAKRLSAVFSLLCFFFRFVPPQNIGILYESSGCSLCLGSGPFFLPEILLRSPFLSS